MPEGQKGMLCTVKARSSPHPALRATFSRRREKGQVCGFRLVLRDLTDSRTASLGLSRERERMPGGQVRALFAVKPKSSPHPALRATFSRRREKGLHRSSR